MYLRNVKPFTFTVKTSIPPTPSPNSFLEHVFLTYVSFEAFEPWQGAAYNLGV
jgi:hypothetical protein